MNTIHTQLQKDCLLLGRFPLSQLLLMNDSNYPWFILVPDRDNMREIFQLSPVDQVQLLLESSQISRHVMHQFDGDKLNVAAIGNLVPQLHLHHVVRYQSDPSWPAPVWGKLVPKPYSERELEQLLIRLEMSALTDFQAA